ncbi:MAG: 4Fe-4S ferredoxin [Acidobacteria bacterium]|nr:4Fe-4S ferredoxin [Acidobacteriota bacterium]MBU4330939.1 4Fe-4S ferredoxin [Acidobacteriota bacterium]MCG2814386.1 4Fe-4S ferredoxin [Candidatus Aminicenantes bacterium]
MMKTKSDPTLLSEIREYGHFDTSACYQCGSCTVVCDLAKDSVSFPRKMLQYGLFGLKKLLRGSPEPWICYYCGDCSTTCPRETEPGEAMMTLRRWLTAQYDWTGLSAKMYKSKIWELGALFAIGAFMAFLIYMFHGPLVTARVELNTFAPVHLVHAFDLIMFAVLAFFLFTNAFRMYWFTMHRDKNAGIFDIIKGFKQDGFGFVEHNGEKVKIPLSMFLAEIKTIIVNFATQKMFLACKKNTWRWLLHFLLVSGYVIMLLLVVALLEWFQTDNIYPITHPQRWLGYYATIVLLFCTVEIIVSRLKKRKQIHKFSDFSDWMFPVLLFLTTVTGILVHIFRYMGLPLATYYTYAIHLVIAVAMLVVEVPFGKWAHLLYRPLAVYFQKVRERALQQQQQVPDEAVSENA